MKNRPSRRETSYPEPQAVDSSRRSGLAIGGICIALLLLTYLVSGPWAGFHALLFAVVGILMMLRPARVPIPTLWWALAAVFVAAASTAFLPARWFPTPEWRGTLESLGVPTGDLVAIQSRMALEGLAIFVITVFGGLWLAGHRADGRQLRVWALTFALGVAAYALISRGIQGSPLFEKLATGAGHFGFFPNRNHTATYLAMGAVCGLGCTLQALRDKRFVILALALVATAICLWAAAAWSISRAGIVLVAIGGTGWILLIGRRYLGRHGLWAVALVALAAVGLFFLSESRVRDRLSETLDKAGTQLANDPAIPLTLEAKTMSPGDAIDFRIPVFRDTAALIRDFPLTGVGAGQFQYIFPQYRQETIVANDSDCLHPESDWLWMAAETGLPATLALAALVAAAAITSIRGIRHGRDRALRAACLVAALLVPIHGLFDVPGHRISLAFTSALLFVLSLQPAAATPAAARLWGGRLFAAALLAIAALLARAEWLDGPKPAIPMAAIAQEQALALHRKDLQEEQRFAAENHQPYDPDPEDDLLLEALDVMDGALQHAPLHRGLRHFTGFLAVHFDDQYERAEKNFEIELALSPGWVGAPLSQAEAWAGIRPETSEDLWKLSLQRASRLDDTSAKQRWGSQAVHQHIQRYVKPRPELEPYAPKVPSAGSPDPR